MTRRAVKQVMPHGPGGFFKSDPLTCPGKLSEFQPVAVRGNFD